MSVVLAIDTAGYGAEIAVARAGALLGAAQLAEPGAFAESLPALLDAALAEAGCSFAEVEAIAVVAGPGSFTGLRIGVMTAKTLSFVRGLPLMAAETLPLLAHAALANRAPVKSVVAALDAGGEHVFAAAFGDALAPLLPVVRLPAVELRAWCAALAAPVLVAARGECADQSAQALLAGGACTATHRGGVLASALAVAQSAGATLAKAVDPLALVPLYVSASQAERARGVDLGAQVHSPHAPGQAEPERHSPQTP